MAYTTTSPPPSYYDNIGFHPENHDGYNNRVQPNVYAPYTISHSHISPVPHYIPNVPPHHTVPANVPVKSQTCCTARKKKVVCIVAAICLLVAAAVIAAVLCWYFVTNNCSSGIACGTSGSCVSASQWCDGTPQCPNGEDESFCVRLFGPGFQLQAYSPQKAAWVPVCGDNWNDNLGKTACKDLGYSTSTYLKSETSLSSSRYGDYMKLNLSHSSSEFYNKLSSSDFCSTQLVVSLRCIDCGYSTKSVGSRIVGGSSTSLGQWPWQVSLQVNGKHICGGSIITPNWIVTAAHCVEGTLSNAYRWTVYAGTVRTQFPTGGSSNVVKVISHPSYNSDTKHYDIALMKLSSSLSFDSNAGPVCLPNAGMMWTTGQTCWITGWGATREGGSSSTTLLAASVPLIDPTVCNKPYVYDGAITSSMICAGYLSGGIDACQGDSGGPLVTKTSSLWWLVGDTSWGTGCANMYKPGVYGNMTVFMEWIYLQMQTNR